MPVLRAYMMQSSGVLPGRGAAKGDPFVGALLGLAGPALKKLGGKALAKVSSVVTKKQGGKAAITRAAKAAGGFSGAVGAGVAGTAIAGRLGIGGARPGGRRRRMNAGNAKALRRAFRRIESFTKLAAKAGYVRRKPFGARRATKKVC